MLLTQIIICKYFWTHWKQTKWWNGITHIPIFFFMHACCRGVRADANEQNSNKNGNVDHDSGVLCMEISSMIKKWSAHSIYCVFSWFRKMYTMECHQTSQPCSPNALLCTLFACLMLEKWERDSKSCVYGFLWSDFFSPLHGILYFVFMMGPIIYGNKFSHTIFETYKFIGAKIP